MKDIKIVGNTPEKKFRHIESILTRMHRRLHKTVLIAVPPIPLFFYEETAKENGEIFQWLFPAAGTIVRACLYIRDFADKEAVTFLAEMKSSTGGQSQMFETRRNATIQEMNIPVAVGDRLTFSTNTPERIKGIWVAFLYQLDMKEVGKEVQMLDDFLKLSEQELTAIVEVPADAIQDPKK